MSILSPAAQAVSGMRDATGLKKSGVAGQGTFRGVPFLVYREQRQRGGRRLVKREYPLRDTGSSDDLGRKLRERTFTAIVLGDDQDSQRDALIAALEAPGAGELNHPEFGVLQVRIDSYECRCTAEETRIAEFTISVIPADESSAPESEKDTAALLANQGDGTLSSLFASLKSGWQDVADVLRDAGTIMDSVSGMIDDAENAINDLGVIADITAFLSSVSAMRAEISGVISAPGRMAARFGSLFEGLRQMASMPVDVLLPGVKNTLGADAPGELLHQAKSLVSGRVYRATNRMQTLLNRRVADINTDGLTAAGKHNMALLTQAVTQATLIVQAEMSSTQLTCAIEQNRRDKNRHRQPDRSEDVRQTHNTVSNLLCSRQDVVQMTEDLGTQLDNAILAQSAAGRSAVALSLRNYRLMLVDDLMSRGVILADARQCTTRQTEPALVTLYRETGDCQEWQRFVRRNGICNPSFVPGGCVMEVLDGE
ncbi:DNA circularization protein [Salmonella enterica]|nr:multidrug DMT transporter permease [Salmonella enterica]